MRYWVGITDFDWYGYLAARPELDEVNFWQPGGGRRAVAQQPGDLFLFKLRRRYGGAIVGGGHFLTFTWFPVRVVWAAFGEKNGAPTFEAMRARLERLRGHSIDENADRIGCNVLLQPFFLGEEDWIPAPADWPPNVVQGKGYDSETGEGALLWARVQAALAAASVREHAIAEDRYGRPMLVQPRLGQGAFRVLVTDAYQRRCSVTGERTLPVLDAAHIKPYAQSGPHQLRNGLLLRKDLHALFDRGYVTVTSNCSCGSAAASVTSSRTGVTTTRSTVGRCVCPRRRIHRHQPSSSSGTATWCSGHRTRTTPERLHRSGAVDLRL
jgi:putative restriction endonuclease